MLKTNKGGLWAIPQMLEMRRRGHEIVFLVPPGPGKLRSQLDDHSVPCVDSRFNFSFRLRWALVTELLALRRQLRELEPDVIFYHLLASALAVRIASLGLKFRRVHMVAGPLYLDSALIRTVERALCRLDDLVIGGSTYTAQRYLDLGMPAERVRAIPYGVDLERFDRSLVTPERSIDAGEFNVIMVAHVYAPKRSVYPGVGIKGHDVLLQAWQTFAVSRPHARLILVGAGFDQDGESHRQFLKREWGHLSSIRWVDTVDDVRPWYAACQLSVAPSLSENHGAALEASAMQCPSIVSDAGALPEAVHDGVTGWVTPRGSSDALGRALEEAHRVWQAGELPKMGVHARELMLVEFDQSECSVRVADNLLASDDSRR